MERGKTYRFGVLTASKCVSTSIFAPGATSFADTVPVAESGCGAMQFFTPGPDGGGVSSMLVKVGGQPTAYHAVVRLAQPDDVEPVCHSPTGSVDPTQYHAPIHSISTGSTSSSRRTMCE